MVLIVIVYFYKVYVSFKFYVILLLIYVVFKWFYFFIFGIISNFLDVVICYNLLEVVKCSKLVVFKKEFIFVDIIKKIIDKYVGFLVNLKDLCLVCMCLLGFVGCFCYDEFSSILFNYLEFLLDYLCVFVFCVKNDVYREGNKVYIKRLFSKYCFVVFLERYILMVEVDFNSNLLFFRFLRLFKFFNIYKLYGSKFLYMRCREVFKNCFKDLGLDYNLYGLYSLRLGGVIFVVSNSISLLECLFKLYGCWKLDCVKDMYVFEDVFKCLVIIDNLGL